MARTQDDVLDELLALTPQGWALPHEAATVWSQFLQPWAAEVSRVETGAEAMLAEIDPRTAANLLPDYERVLGPDPYGRDAAANDLSTQELALLTWQRWTESGGMSAADYIALAAQMGVTITISTFLTAMCGRLQCGQTLITTPHQFEWLVTLPLTQLTLAVCGVSRCGDFLGEITPSPIVPVITGEAPAHTLPVFSYTG